MDDIYSTEVLAGEVASDFPNSLQQAIDTGDSSSVFVPAPTEPVKRKRGRPKKRLDQLPKPSIDAGSMNVVAENALQEIQGSLDLVQSSVENQNHEKPRFIHTLKDSIIKRGRGRPKKNSLPAPVGDLAGIEEVITIQQPIEIEIVESSSPKKRGRGRPRKIPLTTPDSESQPEQVDRSEKFKLSEPMFAEPAKLLRALPECQVTKSQVHIAQVEGPSTTLHLLKDKNSTGSPSENTLKPATGMSDLLTQESTAKPGESPLPSVGGVVQSDTPVIKRKRGRPPKNSLPSAQAPAVEKARKRPQQDLQDEKLLFGPYTKRKPGRPRKVPDTNNTTTEPKIKRKPGRPRKNPEDQQKQKIKRIRGRPKKDQSSDLFLDGIIPAQSSEPIASNATHHINPFPSITLEGPQVFGTESKNNGGFKLQLSSSEEDSASIEDDVAMAIVTLSAGGDQPRPDTLLINESFDESFDEED